MNELYSVRKIKAVEKLAIEKYHTPEAVLMERAGKAAWSILHKKWPYAKRLFVFCGQGNNGGDGYVLARMAAEHGLDVHVYYLGELIALKQSALQAYEAYCKKGGVVKPFSVHELHVDAADVIVDGLLGTGFQGELKGHFLEAVSFINQAREKGVRVLSLDVPSGLNADTGCVLGGVVKADCTVSFVGLKPGLFMADGLDYAGEVFGDALGLPLDIYQEVDAIGEKVDFNQLKRTCLPPRKRNTHKGDYGRLLVIGGNKGMLGSVRMAAEAALRVGAGLVTVATHPDHSSLISVQRPEVMSYGIERPEDLTSLIDRATVIAIGMGLGQSDWSKGLMKKVLESEKPFLLDADALNLLASYPLRRSHWVLTPHPGEAARLLSSETAAIQGDRLAAIEKLQQQYGGVCVLKGAGTLVKGEQKQAYLCSAGNPGMASAGMGDVLSGVIGGLLAQKIPLLKAALLGVCLHAKAADDAAANQGERGLLAMDLMPYLQWGVSS